MKRTLINIINRYASDKELKRNIVNDFLNAIGLNRNYQYYVVIGREYYFERVSDGYKSLQKAKDYRDYYNNSDREFTARIILTCDIE